MDYVKSCDKWFIDTRTWEFIPENDIPLSPLIDVAVPAPLWHFKEEERHVAYKLFRDGILPKRAAIYYSKVDEVQLHGLRVVFHDAYKDATIEFMSNGKQVRLQVKSEPHLGRFKIANTNARGTTYAFNEFHHNGNVVDTKIMFKERSWGWPFFRPVTGCGTWGKASSGLIGDNLFIFVLSNYDYDVSYRGTLLNGKSYALLCGPWAILLSDNLEFDSLVYLNGARGYALDVEHIMYTVNPYMVKMKTLVK